MSYVIYSIIALLIIGIIYGTWERRQIYRAVDRLGVRKVELMNRPVTEELSRMKGLRLSGETEERFEAWRTEWDQLITVQLPDIEERLFEIEELANRYRFPKANAEIKVVEEALDEIKQHIDLLITEVHELVHSEEQNRHDIETLTQYYEETKKKLWVQRGTLGAAAGEIDTKLKGTYDYFKEFKEKTEEGNYFQAGETLVNLKELLERVNYWIDNIPAKLLQTTRDLPAQLRELETGLAEMKREGYPVELLDFENTLKDLRSEQEAILVDLQELRVDDAKERIDKMENSITLIYEELEEEAIAKNKVEKELATQQLHIDVIPNELMMLQEELEDLKMSYQIPAAQEQEVEEFVYKWHELKASFDVMVHASKESEQTFTIIYSQLKGWKEQIKELHQEIEAAKLNFDMLREDERNATETVIELRRFMRSLVRRLKRSSLPKVPALTQEQINEAEKKLSYAEEILAAKPIEMENVRGAVAEAEDEIYRAEKAVEKILDEGELTERIIQYGNRYRTQNGDVQILLIQAEERFRQGYYEEALEFAVKGLEKVDKNGLDRIRKEHADHKVAMH